MRSNLLSPRTASDIDGRVQKILDDLGNPEPPIDLPSVRELLQLDLGYYSSSNAGLLQEIVHKATIAGKQIVREPSRLLDLIQRWDLRALWIPDSREILLSSELPTSKQRWGEAHEIGHSILPWHEPITHGDARHTLSFACQAQLEMEANYVAGRLLFLSERFDEEVRSSPLRFDRILELSKRFGNTMTSTLWRVVESSATPSFGLVSQHPRADTHDLEIRYFVRSPEFVARFENVTELEIFGHLTGTCRRGGGPIGDTELPLQDLDGRMRPFRMETFFNGHHALTLGTACNAAG